MPKKKFTRHSRIDEIVGQRIKTLRRAQGVSQAKLGDALGVTFQQIQKYERGSNSLGPTQLLRVATYFQVPPGLFFDGLSIDINGDPRATSNSVTDLHEKVLEVALQLNAIADNTVRDRLVALVKALTSSLFHKERS